MAAPPNPPTTVKTHLNSIELLKPNIVKIVITLIFPVIVGLLVTHRIENTVSFYGFLLTPRLALWTGEGVVYVFNTYVLLWILFYLVACTITHFALQRGDHPGGRPPRREAIGK